MERISFNHKNLTQNQYSDTFWVQNELIVHNLHLRIGCLEIFAKICGCNVEHNHFLPYATLLVNKCLYETK